MAGIIKKQILKHLSRFAKNLSPDKINLSTLKGEGQLTNLELDEEVLQNMLDLPTWLAINRVFCNKAAIRISWTKLKTHPISLYLDKVVMEMSTCEEPRPPNGPSPIATASGQSEYGFAEKVVEGISLSVNSIVIRIKAKAFNASFELSQLKVYSVNQSWQLSDLRFTRIQSAQHGQILTFKEISWQMIRIEADAIQSGEHEILSAPVRLITNQSKIRVTLKRRLKDCNVVASKLILILDDLLWVLTDSQLKAMVQYAKSLSEAMEKSAQQRKSLASETTQNAAPAQSAQQVKTQQTAAAADHNDFDKMFNSYDVKETSHHMQITHLDLHICDDIHAKDRGINKRITGGAMQLSFSQITVDYYPFHRAGDSCLHWMHYSEATKSRDSWAKNLLDEFKSNMEMLKHAVKDHRLVTTVTSSAMQGSPQHVAPVKISTSSTSTFSAPVEQPKTQLMSSSVVARIADFSIYQVSTADQRRSSPKTMISCNKKTLYLPQEMPAVHIEFTEYYFPDGKDYPIPCPNLYMQMNALQLNLEARSILWLNQFALDLRQSLEQFMAVYKLNDNSKTDEHVDVRVDGLMLKLIVPTQKALEGHQDLPQSLSVQMAEMTATNTRHSSKCTRTDLEAMLQDFKEYSFFSKMFTGFPKMPDSFNVVHPVFQRHAHEQDTKMHDIYKGIVNPTLSTNALKTSSATDVWAVHCTQFWIDYEGTKSGKGRPVPFVDAFPLSIWVCQPAKFARSQELFQTSARMFSSIPKSESVELSSRLQRKRLLKDYYSTDNECITNGIRKPPSLDSISATSHSLHNSLEADIHILVHVQKHVSAQINHYQYNFLMRLQQSIKDLQQNLQKDIEDVTGKPAEETSISVGLLLKSADVALLLQPLPSSDNCSKSPVSIDLGISPSESQIHSDPRRESLHEMTGEKIECVEDAANQHLSIISSVDDLLCKPLEESPAQKTLPLQPSLDCSLSSFDKSDVEDMAVPESIENGGTKGQDGSLELNTLQTAADPLVKNENALEDKESPSHSKENIPNDLSAALNNIKNYTGDSLSEPITSQLGATLLSRVENDKEKNFVNKIPQSVSSGRLMKERSQSSLSVSYKNIKRSPSLPSLDNISLDSTMLEEHLLESDGSDSLKESLAGDIFGMNFRDTMSDQSPAESASEALGNYAEGAMSPDAISAASQSIDENSKDLVSVLVFKIFGATCAIDVKGDDIAVCLQVNRVIPNQVGNISVREYLSNHSLGSDHSALSDPDDICPEVRLRLDIGPKAAVYSPLAAKNGFLHCKIQHFSSDLLMSSLINLGQFLEDDCVPEIVPMKITVSDTNINLKDDSPRINSSAPGPMPVTLNVKNLLVQRIDDGSFCIGAAAEKTSNQEKEMEVRAQTPRSVGSISRATQTQLENEDRLSILSENKGQRVSRSLQYEQLSL
uniref:Bridge-like lipid transfer protein family member 3B n=1 Tax=Erpetoichthys calabaricus TaxID=27687 RepID=A0A8C4S7W5_ERPCA